MDNDYQAVLRRLREERERRNLTQRLLGYCMGMQQEHYSKAETGHGHFSYRELKGLCTSDVDILYVFTGRRPEGGREFFRPLGASLEEAVCHLSTVHILAGTAWSMGRDNAAFGIIRQQLRYIQCNAGNAGAKGSIFLFMRNLLGYTQQEMADILGMDLKKLRKLEQRKQLPDSEIVWKMYDRFQVSPAFILEDAKGLWDELNDMLGLLDEDDRGLILLTLENGHKLLEGTKQQELPQHLP